MAFFKKIDQLAALLGVANGTVSPNNLGNPDPSSHSMAAMAAAGFPGNFPSLLPCSVANPSCSTSGTLIGDYSNAGDLDGSSGWC